MNENLQRLKELTEKLDGNPEEIEINFEECKKKLKIKHRDSSSEEQTSWCGGQQLRGQQNAG